MVASYGVPIQSYEHDGRVQLCYNGEAFRRVLAMNANNEQRARAALALTRPECIDPSLTPVERNSVDKWRADILERAKTDGLPEYEKTACTCPPQEAETRAIQELAAVNKEEITDAISFCTQSEQPTGLRLRR